MRDGNPPAVPMAEKLTCALSGLGQPRLTISALMSYGRKRRGAAKVEWHPHVCFIVTNLSLVSPLRVIHLSSMSRARPRAASLPQRHSWPSAVRVW